MVSFGFLAAVCEFKGDNLVSQLTLWRRRAGAHWLPHSRAHEPVICDWDVQTYDYWLDLIRKEEEDPKLPSSGLKVWFYSLNYLSTCTSKKLETDTTIPANRLLPILGQNTRL